MPTLNQPEIKGKPLLTLHGGSGDHYEMAPLMAPKTITMWAWTLLHHGARFMVIECWQLETFIGFRLDGVLVLAPSTLLKCM